MRANPLRGHPVGRCLLGPDAFAALAWAGGPPEAKWCARFGRSGFKTPLAIIARSDEVTLALKSDAPIQMTLMPGPIGLVGPGLSRPPAGWRQWRTIADARCSSQWTGRGNRRSTRARRLLRRLECRRRSVPTRRDPSGEAMPVS